MCKRIVYKLARPVITVLAFRLSLLLLASAAIQPAQSLGPQWPSPMLWYRWYGLEECSVGNRGKLDSTVPITVSAAARNITQYTPASLLVSSLLLSD